MKLNKRDLLVASSLTTVLSLTTSVLPTPSLASEIPPTFYNGSDPTFSTLLPYSLLSSVIMCDPSSYIGSADLWDNCPTCKSLKWTPPTLLRVLRGQVVSPTDPSETAINAGLLAAVTYNTTTRTAAVVFRGSKDVDNFIVDAKAIKETSYNGIGFHAGFLAAYQTLEPLVAKELIRVLTSPDACPVCDTVVFTGHSLGAAMATIATYVFITNNTISDKKIRLITFGSPRVSTSAMWDTIEKSEKVVEQIRLVNGQDVVPTIPFSTSGTPVSEKYVHGPSLHWYSAEDITIRHCTKPTDVNDIGEGAGVFCNRTLNTGPRVLSGKRIHHKFQWEDIGENWVGKEDAAGWKSRINLAEEWRAMDEESRKTWEELGETVVKTGRIERRQNLGSTVLFANADDRNFGPFPQGSLACTEDYSRELDAIPYHQTFDPATLGPVTIKGGTTTRKSSSSIRSSSLCFLVALAGAFAAIFV
ncbi:hypothetical protein HDU97_005588 [Phlyctochytrium planicorne]|nr:hypothetical protein HDU97_005588 [Phlyctochytrium planicorne]